MEEFRAEEILPALERMLKEKDYRAVRSMLEDERPIDVAEAFDELSPESCVVVFRLLNKNQAAEVFSYLSAAMRREIADAINSSVMSQILDELYFDDKIDFLEEMPANFVRTILQNTPPEERKLINQFLQYPDNSAGSLMTIEYVSLGMAMTVAEALAVIRKTGYDKETIYTCYVIGETRRLEGIVSLKRLVLSDSETLIADIMDEDAIKVEALDDQEMVAEHFKRYDLMAMAVVDKEDRMLGIITIDDVVDVIERENTEDFHKMAAIMPSGQNYLDTGIFKLAKMRVLWLMVLMISATFTGSIISRFEGLLSSAVVLTVFIPMLMNTGGNAGSQSATLIIRGIALGDIDFGDLFKVIWKEMRVSLLVGVAMAVVNALRLLVFTHTQFNVVLTVSLTLMATIFMAKLIGGMLPIAAKALKLDPAIMASPLISTVCDAFTLIIYFSIASALVL